MSEKGATTFAIFLCFTFHFIIFLAAFLLPLKALNANEIGIC